MRALAALLALLIPIGSEAAVTDFLGQPVAGILVHANGVPLHDPALDEIIETRPGAPLSMVEVRESIAISSGSVCIATCRSTRRAGATAATHLQRRAGRARAADCLRGRPRRFRE